MDFNKYFRIIKENYTKILMVLLIELVFIGLLYYNINFIIRLKIGLGIYLISSIQIIYFRKSNLLTISALISSITFILVQFVIHISNFVNYSLLLSLLGLLNGLISYMYQQSYMFYGLSLSIIFLYSYIVGTKSI